MPFLDSLDVGNRALQHCGQPPIVTVDEDSKANSEVSFAYDKLRRAELRRNVWRFAIRHAVLRPVDTDTMIIAPAAWDATKTYLPGSIVSDANGQLWITNDSDGTDNINNEPGDTDAWEMYFGPMTVSLFDTETSYFAGELVYVLGAVAGAYSVYMSLQNANDDVPGTATAFAATVTYKRDDTVTYLGSQWRSLIEANLNVTPADGPLAYDSTATYTIAQTVTGSDNFIYSSVGNGNVGHDPVTDGGIHWTNTLVAHAWSRSPTLVVSSIKWRPLIASIRNLSFTYPIGSGPSSQSSTQNVFRLPSGFLRKAPQDPKAGGLSYLGAPSGTLYNDWKFEGNYIVSSQIDVMVFRFVADITDVSSMDDMFCEGFACRIAVEVCESLTQSASKIATIAAAYRAFMGEARTINAIETGTEELPEDDYIACRG